MISVLVVARTLVLSPQTLISLFSGAIVEKPAPFIVNYFPPTKDVVTADVIVGGLEKLTVIVAGVTEANHIGL